MKFKAYLTSIENVAIYPIISLVIFTTFFAAVIIYTFSMSKKQIKEREDLPLK